VASEGYLDEDRIKQQIETKRKMQNSINSTASVLNILMKIAMSSALFDIAQNRKRELDQMSDDLQQDIDELQKKLDKLHEFDDQTKNLFHGSLDELKLAMQGVLVLNATTINSDGTYKLPKGVDKSWFEELKSKDQQEEMEEKVESNALKELNDLFEKNPMAAIEMVKNDDRLFGYVLGALDKCPKKIQDAALALFIAQESWNTLPQKLVTKVMNSPKFASYMSKASFATQAIIYSGLIKLHEKGWSVLAPIGYATNILSKTSDGAKLIAGSKVGLEAFRKIGKVSEFIKTHKVAAEGISYAGDVLSVTAYAYDEYINPESPAYGDASKAIYGGINLFLWNAGPLEGEQYGGPVGAIAGTANTVWQFGKYNLINYFPKLFPGGKDSFGWNKETDKRAWLDELYKQYGQHEAVPTDKEYQTGIQPQSGSPSFNPSSNTGNKINMGVNSNKSPYENWGVK
ncbi:hypothetical protein ACRW9N_06775, partial [Listeria aquatica]|uniref:hypothetical protein n=1 Tax=Listeria aquatica TaxID=1494960 RepID=UPI003EF61ABB